MTRSFRHTIKNRLAPIVGEGNFLYVGGNLPRVYMELERRTPWIISKPY
ncbi:hypothetical protein EMIT07CA2_30340 [Brevibacillus sp. IT-7CA2]